MLLSLYTVWGCVAFSLHVVIFVYCMGLCCFYLLHLQSMTTSFKEKNRLYSIIVFSFSYHWMYSTTQKIHTFIQTVAKKDSYCDYLLTTLLLLFCIVVVFIGLLSSFLIEMLLCCEMRAGHLLQNKLNEWNYSLSPKRSLYFKFFFLIFFTSYRRKC
ncbi:hypothetical protein UPYG_G00236530 [Umbra pygmaea]|uniref:Uncharacterized protein n=1 Tax=Umbra pygmaea TaxID=75934 RepID=A0ABD0WYP6_UMBPY